MARKRKKRTYKKRPQQVESSSKRFSSREKVRQGNKILREEADDKIAASMLSDYFTEDVLDATDLNESLNYYMLKNNQRKSTGNKKGKKKGTKK